MARFPLLVLLASLACSSDSPDAAVIHLAPDEPLRAPLERWAARWQAATGARIIVGSEGYPFEYWTSVVVDGVDRPGWTSPERDRVMVHHRANIESTVGHELGHLLGGDHTETDGVLSGYPERRDVIDTAALTSVCARLACSRFTPESE